MTSTRQVDPLDYSERESSMESDVLRLERGADFLVLTINYIWGFEAWPTDYAEFRRLWYCGVERFVQSDVRSLGHFTGLYEAASTRPRVIVVTHEEIQQIGGEYYADYCFSDLGCFEFRFEELRVEKKSARAVECEDGEWLYEDEHGELLDTFAPFAENT